MCDFCQVFLFVMCVCVSVSVVCVMLCFTSVDSVNSGINPKEITTTPL